jgi:sensor histidine kinase regulating citrate/malate metabolism
MLTASELPLLDPALPLEGPPPSRIRDALTTKRGTINGSLLALTLVGAGLLVAHASDGFATVEDEAMISLLTSVMTAVLFEMKTAVIADRGRGVPEESCEKVFEKFFRGSQAPKRDGGVGLGLTICRAVLRARGGKISVRVRLQGGTVVEFTLPVVGLDSSPCRRGTGGT